MEKIGQRKLQKVGDSLLISLPADWVRRMEVSKGSIIDLYQENDRLILEVA